MCLIVCGVYVLSWCSGLAFEGLAFVLAFELVLTLGVYYIIYYTIIYYTIIYYIILLYIIHIHIHIHILLLYIILSYTLLFFLTLPLPYLPFSSDLSSSSFLSSSSPFNIHSIRVGTYIYLLISRSPINNSDPACFIGVDG